jgi:WD40 repeat protein
MSTPLHGAWFSSMTNRVGTYAQNAYQATSRATENYFTSLAKSLNGEFEESSERDYTQNAEPDFQQDYTQKSEPEFQLDCEEFPASQDYPQEFEPETNYTQQRVILHEPVSRQLSPVSQTQPLISNYAEQPLTSVPITVQTSPIESTTQTPNDISNIVSPLTGQASSSSNMGNVQEAAPIITSAPESSTSLVILNHNNQASIPTLTSEPEVSIPPTANNQSYFALETKSITAEQYLVPQYESKKQRERASFEEHVKKILYKTGITALKKTQNSFFLSLPNEHLFKILKFVGITWRIQKTIPLPWIRECIQIKKSSVIAAIDINDDINIFDLQQNKLLKNTFKAPGGYYRKLALLPQGTIAIPSRNNICLYDLSSGTCIKTLQGHEAIVSSLAFLPDGTLASGSRDTTVKIWNLQSGECLKTLRRHTKTVSSLAVLPNRTLASGSWDTTINLWDTESGSCLTTLIEHTQAINDLIVLSNGTLASSSDDGTIKIWHQNNCIKTLSVSSCWIKNFIALSSRKFISRDERDDILFTDNHTKKIYSKGITTEGAPFGTVTALEDGSFLSAHTKNMRIWKSFPDFGLSCEKISQQS